jgi:hypothetical protein
LGFLGSQALFPIIIIYFFTSHNINCSTRLIEVRHVGDMLATYQHDEHMSVNITLTRGQHVSK